MKKLLLPLFFLCLTGLSSQAQLLQPKQTFTHADTLRGMLTPFRTCYDINYYHLDVKFDIDQKFISGNNEFRFTATQDFTKLQFDLFANLKIEKVIFHGKTLPYTRDENAVFITFPSTTFHTFHLTNCSVIALSIDVTNQPNSSPKFLSELRLTTMISCCLFTPFRTSPSDCALTLGKHFACLDSGINPKNARFETDASESGDID